MQGIFAGTFLIGLREGLEATLIVSIVGAFLARSGRSLRPMAAGVVAAVALSIAVGVGLDVLSAALPQRQQEGLETVVGAVAVVFVTTMIIWMNRNAMHLKGELEGDAQRAIARGGSIALAVMAFLAVLKEGFETAVFLLAAAESTHGSRWAAIAGAVVGIAVAIVIGVGIFFGGLKVNLGRFFRVTGVFLVLIAAGLVTSALRSAHEAGWLDVGQRRAVDLSTVIPPGSLRGAVVTGMFGIPADPRLVEVVGWLLYAVPVLIVFLLPARLTAAPRTRRRVLAAVAAGLVTAAAALAFLVPAGAAAPGVERIVSRADGTTATVRLMSSAAGTALAVDGAATVPLAAAGTDSVDGLDVDLLQATVPADPHVEGATTTLSRLSDLAGGRLPVGLAPARTPGPFDVSWQASTTYTVVRHDDSIVRASAESNRVAVLHGGGLTAAKTVSLGGTDADWTTTDDGTVAARVADASTDTADLALWRRWLPTALTLGALLATWCLVRPGAAVPTKERETRESPSPEGTLDAA